MSDPVVRTRHLTKRFDGLAVLDDVSVSAEPGDVIGVLGKNGAGKTTLLEVILGFSPPSDGSADVFGRESLRLPAAVKARIGFVPQRDELIDMMTGQQQLDVAACLQPRWNRALVDQLAREWDVPRRERIWKLSVGERQKLSILLALGHEPDLLVFDEPVASLDPIARREFLRQIWDLSTDDAKTIVFSSHIGLGPGTRGQQGLDSQAGPHRLAGSARRAEGDGRPPAHPRAAAARRCNRRPARPLVPYRRPHRRRLGCRLAARGGRRPCAPAQRRHRGRTAGARGDLPGAASMIAVVRLSLSYFVLHASQRWLLAIGACLCGLGLLAYAARPSGTPMFVTGLLAVHLPAIPMAAIVFRDLSMHRISALTPHFRVKMLASLLLLATAIGLTWHLSAPVWLPPADAAAAPSGTTFVAPFGFVTALALGIIVGSTSSVAWGAMLSLWALVFAMFATRRFGWIAAIGVDPVLLAASGSVLAWVAFTAWYLTTPRVGRLWPPPFNAGAMPADEQAELTASAAVASRLTGAPAPRAPRRQAGKVVLGAVVVCLALWMFHALLPPASVSIWLAWAIIYLVVGAGVLAARDVRRARWLWLTHGARAEIFHLCERHALRRSSVVTVALAASIGAAAWALGIAGPSAAMWSLALVCSAMLFSIYLGLMSTEGWHRLDIALWTALILTSGLALFPLASDRVHPVLLAVLFTMQIAGAVACRAVARWRWEAIDWRRLRSLRWLEPKGPHVHTRR